MRNVEEITKGKKLLELVKAKAQKDIEFREELIKYPKNTLEKIPGVRLKKSSVNVVVENQMNPNFVYLNIPRKVDIDDYELTDDELESISGGTSIFGIECAVIIAGAAIIGAVVAINSISEELAEGWNSVH